MKIKRTRKLKYWQNHYRLKGHTPVKVRNEREYIDAWNRDKRRVDYTKKGSIFVSTVFLPINHNWNPDGPPIVFETMIFGGPHNDYQERYSTWDEAIAGHQRACALAFPKRNKKGTK